MFRAFLHHLRTNPLCHFLLRQDFVPSQVAMLLFAVVFAGSAFAFMKMQILNGLHLVFLFGVRWATGEFFWCWMAADHLFTNIGRARQSGRLREWTLTALNPAEVAGGFAFSTAAFLVLGQLLWFWFDLMNPFPRLVAGTARMDGVVAVLHHGAAWALLAGQIPTVLLASSVCTSRALELREPSIGRWAMTMVRLAGLSWVSLWPGVLAAWLLLRIEPGTPLLPSLVLVAFVLIGNSLKLRFAVPALEKAVEILKAGELGDETRSPGVTLGR